MPLYRWQKYFPEALPTMWLTRLLIAQCGVKGWHWYIILPLGRIKKVDIHVRTILNQNYTNDL